MKDKIDFLAIGDTTTDAFIRLKDASVHCDIDKENCQLCMGFGEKIPYEFVKVVRAVGNSANASVSASRLGLKSALVSNLGDDQNGKECLDELAKNGISTDFVKTHPGKSTNYHYVLWYEDDRTILIKHEDYDYSLPDIGAPRWIYLSSIGNGEKAVSFHQEVADYLKKNPEVKLAFQPGTFQINAGYEKLKGIYERTEVFFVNVGEAKKIIGRDEDDIKKLLEAVRALGPKITVITDGPSGAYVYDGNNFWKMPKYPDPKPPLERTGAGDSFASTFVSALALGLPVEEAMVWAPINSMSVVQYVGAQEGLLTQEKLKEHLVNAPADYRPIKI